MDLEQKARWQHGVLIAAALGVVCGVINLLIGLFGGVRNSATAVAVGAGVVAVSAVVGYAALRSLRAAVAHAAALDRRAAGAFELPPGAPDRLADLNERLATHFGLPPRVDRSPMPATLDGLARALADLAPAATLRPDQHRAARDALAAALDRPPESVRWGDSPAALIPAGRGRFPAWERLRAAAPTLPAARLNPWVESAATYLFLAALIAIAVPIAQRLDANEATRIAPAPGTQLIGKAFGLVLFGSIIAALMIPVRLYGIRYAARLPKGFDGLGPLSHHFPTAGREGWTAPRVAEHLRDLVPNERDLSAR